MGFKICSEEGRYIFKGRYSRNGGEELSSTAIPFQYFF